MVRATDCRPNTVRTSQGVAVQPIGEAGVLVAATDTVRGFSALDQAWLAAIADKLDATLEAAGSGKAAHDRQQPAVAAPAEKSRA